MNAVVRPAITRDIDAICALLHSRMNSRIPVERWRKLMTYKWFDKIPDFGRVVDSDGEILGYCGMVYVNRVIGNTTVRRRKERMVSMSSWYLDKSLRGQGLGKKMLVDCTQDRNQTYATLTNSSKPLGIVESCGFQILEDHRLIWHKSGPADPALNIIRDASTIRERVDEFDRRLIDDMADQPLQSILLLVDSAECLMFFSVKRKNEDVLWFDLMFASDLNLFQDYSQLLANALLPDDLSVLAADGRFVPDPPPGAERRSLPVPRFYKSERVAPQEIDHLYSELQLLDLKLD